MPDKLQQLYTAFVITLTRLPDLDPNHSDVAHSIGVQNVILPFFIHRNRFIMFWSCFFLKLGVYIRLVKS